MANHYVADANGGFRCRLVAEHIEDGGLTTPIVAVFSDRIGRAEKMLIE